MRLLSRDKAEKGSPRWTKLFIRASQLFTSVSPSLLSRFRAFAALSALLFRCARKGKGGHHQRTLTSKGTAVNVGALSYAGGFTCKSHQQCSVNEAEAILKSEVAARWRLDSSSEWQEAHVAKKAWRGIGLVGAFPFTPFGLSAVCFLSRPLLNSVVS